MCETEAQPPPAPDSHRVDGPDFSFSSGSEFGAGGENEIQDDREGDEPFFPLLLRLSEEGNATFEVGRGGGDRVRERVLSMSVLPSKHSATPVTRPTNLPANPITLPERRHKEKPPAHDKGALFLPFLSWLRHILSRRPCEMGTKRPEESFPYPLSSLPSCVCVCVFVYL